MKYHLDIRMKQKEYKKNQLDRNKTIPLEMDPGGGPRGPGPPLGPIFFFSYNIFHFCSQAPFSTISLTSLTQIATIQPKNVIKTIKIFTMVILFQPKKNYFTTKEQKNHVLLENKSKFFATTVNWYKYQLTIVGIHVDYSRLLKIKYNILLRSFN